MFEDSIAPMANNVQDLGIMMDVLTQQRRPYWSLFDEISVLHYSQTSLLHRSTYLQISRLRLGVVSNFTYQAHRLEFQNRTYVYPRYPN